MSVVRKILAARLSAALLLGLFVLGAWLAPVLHKVHCRGGPETASAAAATDCSHGASSASPDASSDHPSQPARPGHAAAECVLCQIAKLSIQEATPAVEVALVSFCRIGSPPAPGVSAMEPIARLPRSRAPPV